MKKSLNYLPLIALLFVCNVNAQTWSYQAIPSTYLTGYAVTTAERTAALATETDWHDLTTDLPAGPVTDGSVNYRSYLQVGLNNFNHCIMPDFPVLIDSMGLSIISKSHYKLLFKANSKLIMKANSSTSYKILFLNNVSNSIFYFLNIQGDRIGHIPISGNTSELCHGLYIQSGDSLTIEKPTIKNCNGDGLVLTQTATPTYGTIINKAYLDNNRRNGFTIGSTLKLIVNGMICSNTNGTEPSLGLDIEPESVGQNLINIVFNDFITFNNYKGGISIYPRKLLWSTTLPQKNINIIFNRHIDSLSDKAFGITTSWTSTPQYITILGGNITFNDSRWRSQRGGIIGTITDFANNNTADIKFDWGCHLGGVSYGCTYYHLLSDELTSEYGSSSNMPSWIILSCCLTKEGQGKNNFDEISNKFTIYPNPSDDNFKLQLETIADNFTIKLTSLDGKVLLTQTGSGNYATVDISKLAPGMYFVEVNDGVNKSVKRLVKE